jgi:hypothetical protein
VTPAALTNALLGTRDKLPPEAPVKVLARKVVIGLQPDGARVYALSDPVELSFARSHAITYPSKIGERGDLTGVEVLEDLSRGPGSSIWRDEKGKGLPDDQVYRALLEACVELEASADDARNLSRGTVMALAHRKGASPDPARLP